MKTNKGESLSQLQYNHGKVTTSSSFSVSFQVLKQMMCARLIQDYGLETGNIWGSALTSVVKRPEYILQMGKLSPREGNRLLKSRDKQASGKTLDALDYNHSSRTFC